MNEQRNDIYINNFVILGSQTQSQFAASLQFLSAEKNHMESDVRIHAFVQTERCGNLALSAPLSDPHQDFANSNRSLASRYEVPTNKTQPTQGLFLANTSHTL